jgi:hypothetical protein
MSFRISAALALLILVSGCTVQNNNSGKSSAGRTPGRKVTGRAIKSGVTRKPTAAARPGKSRGVVYYMRGSKANVVYSARDMGSGIHTVEVWIKKNGGKWTKYAEDKNLAGKVLFVAKQEGVFAFATVGIDQIGNREKTLDETSVPDFTVVVDRTAPKVTAKGPGKGVMAIVGRAFNFSWKAEDGYLGRSPVELQVRYMKNPVWTSVSRNQPAVGALQLVLPETDDDVAEIRILARDKSGNVGSCDAGSVVFDRKAPVGRVLGPKTATGLKIKVKYEVSDPGAAKLTEVALWITSNRGRRWSKLVNAPTKSGEVDVILPGGGTFGLAISAKDSAGNLLKPPGRGTRPQFVLGTDKRGPRIETLSWIKSGKVVSSARGVTVKWSVTDSNLGNKPVTVQYTIDNGKVWKDSGMKFGATGSFTWKPSSRINSKACKLRISAADRLRNPAVKVSPVFTVDNTAPTTRATFELVEDVKAGPVNKPAPVVKPVTRPEAKPVLKPKAKTRAQVRAEARAAAKAKAQAKAVAKAKARAEAKARAAAKAKDKSAKKPIPLDKFN